MSYSQYYGGAIWTHHAIERMQQRKLPQDLALAAFQHPDQSLNGKQSGTQEYRKRIDNHTVTIIAKKNEKGEWLILSTWVDPPFYGTADYDKKQKYNDYMRAYRKASFLGKIWLELKSAFFK